MNCLMIKRSFNLIFLTCILIFFQTGCKAPKPKPILSIDLPRIENFSLDGNANEWQKVESYKLWADPFGNYPDSLDLEANLKAAWNKTGLVLLLEVKDQSFVYDTLSPWKGDAIEVFLSAARGSGEIFQVSVIPFPNTDFIRTNDQSVLNDSSVFIGKIKSFTRINGKRRTTEIEIPIRNKKSETGIQSFALQVNADDSDSGRIEKNQLVWCPYGQSYSSSFNMFSVNFNEEKQSVLKGSTRLIITDNEIIQLYVFGTLPGDKIGVFRNGKFLKNFRSKSKDISQPETFNITSMGWDTEKDSLFVTINDVSLPLIELPLAPRLYKKLVEKPFEREIRNFIIKDRQSFPPENATLFIGSSSIVRWKTLKKDFSELQVIQRGFGGSTSADVLLYINQIVLPYKPSKIVYYEGDNDIPNGISSREICNNIKTFIDTVSALLPKTHIYILSPKPSINRMYLWEKYVETQTLIKNLTSKYQNIDYVNVAAPMFDEKGILKHSLFVEDGIHMNKEGYAIWTKVIRKALQLD